MPVYTVDIACRASGFDYAPLFEALRRIQAQPFMEGRWLIDVTQDVQTVTRVLLRHCAVGDGLTVMELTPETRWTGTGLGEDAKAWIVNRFRVSPTPPPTSAAAARLH